MDGNNYINERETTMKSFKQYLKEYGLVVRNKEDDIEDNTEEENDELKDTLSKFDKDDQMGEK